MAQALREAYRNLFETFPDAYRKDEEALQNFFSTHTSVGAKAVGSMIRTFKALIELADFNSEIPDSEEEIEPEKTSATPVKKSVAKVHKPASDGLVINVNIQLQIPPTEDASIYDKFFESMRKHILSKGDE